MLVLIPITRSKVYLERITIYGRYVLLPLPPPRPINPTNSERLVFLIEDFKKRLNKTGFQFHPLRIDEDKSLHMHLVFWFPILLFVSLGISLTIPFWCLCWPNPTDYDILLKQLGFPVFVASLALPITIAIGRFHGSKQRAKANKLNETNIAFNHYFDHKQYFNDYLQKTAIPELYRDLITVDNPEILYSLFFPNNQINRQDFTIDKERFDKKLNAMADKFFVHVDTWVKSVNNGTVEDDFVSFENFVSEMPKVFGLKFSKMTPKAFVDYTNKTSFTFFSFCFEGIRDTLQLIQSFNHTQRRGWSVVLTFQPFIDSLESDENLIQADTKAMEILVAKFASDFIDADDC
jgi:hypothetical protein